MLKMPSKIQAGPLHFPCELEQFLADYWQQKPLFMPNAVADFTPPLSSDELAGLAMEEDVESRIVEERGGAWSVSHGPFELQDFQRPVPWSLLVQAVDCHVPAVAQLQKLVASIGLWRLDDVMVSYGIDGASVGPHFDNYDVFLLQGEGEKRWKIGQNCDKTTALLPDDQVKILRQFDVREEFLLRTGDILYVPPGVAHWGVAVGESTTFSIGFRAPRVQDLLARFADQSLEDSDADIFYRDPPLNINTLPGEIRAIDRARACELVLQQLRNDTSARWFGELVTEPRDELVSDQALEGSLECLAQYFANEGAHLLPGAKLAWQDVPDSQAIEVFANGQSLTVSLEIQSRTCVREGVIMLCSAFAIEPEYVANLLRNDSGQALMHFLLETGCIDAG